MTGTTNTILNALLLRNVSNCFTLLPHPGMIHGIIKEGVTWTCDVSVCCKLDFYQVKQ